MARIRVTAHLSLDENDLEENFIHASGPGGQNVNKVASAVQLRFDARNAGLPFDLHARLEALAGSRLTKNGVIIITARQYRDQQRNRDDARARLVALLRTASIAPKKRKPTKPSKAAKRKGIEQKKRQARIKKIRSKKIEF